MPESFTSALHPGRAPLACHPMAMAMAMPKDGLTRSGWLALVPLVLAIVGGASAFTGCAQHTYQIPPDAPPVVMSDRPDGGSPPTGPPSRRGIIVPGDPASGTTRLGTEGSEMETQTGTNGTRVHPGGSDGK
jgi:hypothetical protein